MATVQGGFHGQELEKQMRTAGITRVQMAERLGVDVSTIGRWFTGARSMSKLHLTMFLTECGCTSEEIQLFEVRNSTTFDPVWGTLGATTDRASVIGALLRAEQQTSKIYTVASGGVPALMQTSEYASFVMARDGVPQDQISSRVAERMGRASMARERTDLEFDILLDEAVLLRTVGTTFATLAQIRHLHSLSALPHVNIQVVPFSAGWSVAQYGPFSIYEFPNDSAVAFLEFRKVMVFFNEPEDVDGTYRASIDQVRPLAMSPEDSRGFMLEKVRELEKL